MGSTYYKALYPQIDTKVALLNIGSEEIKGTETIKKAYNLLKKKHHYSHFDLPFH